MDETTISDSTPSSAPPLDVASIMASAVPKPLTGSISNADGTPVNGGPRESGSQNGPNIPPPFTAEPPKKRQYRKREKQAQPDPLWQAVEQARFGQIAVMCERMFFKACEADDMTEEEAVNLDHASNVIMYHLLKQNPNPREVLPWAAFIAAATFPVAARVVPIAKATEGFWKKSWDLISEGSKNVFAWVSDKIKRKPVEANGGK